MIAALIHLLVLLIILFIVYYIVQVAVTHLGAPAVIVQLVGLVLLLIFLLAALSTFGIARPWWRGVG